MARDIKKEENMALLVLLTISVLPLNEALQLKAKYKNKAHFLAGGADLIVNIREGA